MVGRPSTTNKKVTQKKAEQQQQETVAITSSADIQSPTPPPQSTQSENVFISVVVPYQTTTHEDNDVVMSENQHESEPQQQTATQNEQQEKEEEEIYEIECECDTTNTSASCTSEMPVLIPLNSDIKETTEGSSVSRCPVVETCEFEKPMCVKKKSLCPFASFLDFDQCNSTSGSKMELTALGQTQPLSLSCKKRSRTQNVTSHDNSGCVYTSSSSSSNSSDSDSDEDGEYSTFCEQNSNSKKRKASVTRDSQPPPPPLSSKPPCVNLENFDELFGFGLWKNIIAKLDKTMSIVALSIITFINTCIFYFTESMPFWKSSLCILGSIPFMFYIMTLFDDIEYKMRETAAAGGYYFFYEYAWQILVSSSCGLFVSLLPFMYSRTYPKGFITYLGIASVANFVSIYVLSYLKSQ